jgi:hypothetical protein
MTFLRSSSVNGDIDGNNTPPHVQQQQQQQFDDIHKTSNDMDDDDYDNLIISRSSNNNNNSDLDEVEKSRQLMASPVSAVGRGGGGGGRASSSSFFNNSNNNNKPTAKKMMTKTTVGNTNQQQQRSRRRPPPPPVVPESKSRRLLLTVSTIAILGSAAYLTWKYGLDEPTNWAETQEGAGNLWQAAGNKWNEWDLGNFSDVLDGLDNLDFGNLFDNDPKLGDNTTYVWQSDYIEPSNGGLHLTIRNALDDNWQTEFEQAIADWKESDALVLSTERVDVDHSCTPVDGYMVVCNANFGATGWVGINENSIVRDVIVSSVAKMNEYYLLNADYDHRRFTMCHEIGHGESIVQQVITEEDPSIPSISTHKLTNKQTSDPFSFSRSFLLSSLPFLSLSLSLSTRIWFATHG